MTSEHNPAFDRLPASIDLDKPNAARVYDYYLGGGHNFAVDREFAAQVLATFPEARNLARRARRWLRQAVQVLAADYGVQQFLDLGAGIPSAGCVHEVAREVHPHARVLYVDNEAVAVASTQQLVDGLGGVAILEEDFTRPDLVVRHPLTTTTLDLSRPVAVIFSCTLHQVPNEQDPAAIVAAYRDATAPGSFLAISHGTSDNRPDFAEVARKYQGASNGFFTRTHSEIAAFFDGYELIEPGLAFTGLWRPEDPDDTGDAYRSGCYAGVAHKPGP